MICPKCKANTPDNQSICINCGSRTKLNLFDKIYVFLSYHKFAKIIITIIAFIIFVNLFILDNENNVVETETIPKVEYINLCKNVSYKDLVRYPDEHIGDYIKLELNVLQVMDKGFFDVYKSYRCCTKSDYGYYGDEYYILDARETDSTKILEDDIIIVYGQYKGTSEMLRSITFITDEIATIEAKYIDIITK